MTIYELIKEQKAMIARLHRNGISTDSVRYLPPYERYCELMQQGNKKSYALDKAAEEHGIKQRWLRCIIDFMRSDVN